MARVGWLKIAKLIIESSSPASLDATGKSTVSVIFLSISRCDVEEDTDTLGFQPECSDNKSARYLR